MYTVLVVLYYVRTVITVTYSYLDLHTVTHSTQLCNVTTVIIVYYAEGNHTAMFKRSKVTEPPIFDTANADKTD